MKFDTQLELKSFYDTVKTASNETYDDSGDLIAFTYEKKTSGHTHQKINVSLRKSKQPKQSNKVHLSDQEFFKLLYENYDKVINVRKIREKIIKFNLDGVTYEADKPEGMGLFDIFPFKTFKRYCRSRFYDDDTILRNGYFSGLQGSSAKNILKYQNHKDKYNLYDIDINHAYPEMWKNLLPTGAFYNHKQWTELKEKPLTYMNFYHIVLKTVPNSWDLFISIPPYVEYRDFDFLCHKQQYEMVVSEYRLYLIDVVYGDDSYIIKDKFYCATKIYLGIQKFVNSELEKIEKEKDASIDTMCHKQAVNMLVGMFGQKDEVGQSGFIRVVQNEYGNVLSLEYAQHVKKRKFSYLPLAMTVVDMVAVELFYMLTQSTQILPLSWNTDGAVIAVPKQYAVQNERGTGKIKSALIHDPRFFETTYLYNRPLIWDKFNNKIYNSKVIFYSKKYFNMEILVNINTDKGFFRILHNVRLPRERWHPCNLRHSELLIKLHGNEKYITAMKNSKLFKNSVNDEFNRLAFPYDARYNSIRHACGNYWIDYPFLFKKWYKKT